MKKNIQNNKTRNILSIFAFMLLFLYAPITSAEGSKDLYPSGAQGGRAYLRASTDNSLAYPFPNLGTHYVYAEVGEQIALATSAQAFGSNNTARNNNRNNILLYGPNGNQITLSTGNNNDTRGRISNRSAELAGPQLPGQSSGNRYTPIYHEVTVEGIYKVEFLSTSRNTTGDVRMDYIAANGDWVQGGSSNYLAAWDISVATQIGSTWSWANGRAYTTVVSMDNPSFGSGNGSASFRPNSGFYGKFKVLTKDGYVYNVDNNGNQGISFTFMVNNRGFQEVENPSRPSYHSILAPDASSVTNRYHDPRAVDSEETITQKIFYNLPDGNMPATALGGPVANQETWLRNQEETLDITGVHVEGVEGVLDQMASKGGYIVFDSDSGADYYISIIPSATSEVQFPARLFEGTSVVGENKIFWDGRDGNGALLDGGIANAIIDVQLRGAEVHFPYIDMELNHNGIKLELLNKDLESVRSDIVYWNDTAIGNGGGGSGSKTNPRDASHTAIPAGISSNLNGHIWGLNSNATAGTFGDEMGMDTWTFIEGASVEIEFDVDIAYADLYTKIDYTIGSSSNPTSAVIGNNVVFKVKAGNYGPSDVIADHTNGIHGAPFTFHVPQGVEITDPHNISVATSCSNGTVAEAIALTYDSATKTFSSELSLPANCYIEYTFTGTLTGSGVMTPESTIMRPADVSDIDATNGDPETPPTNPHFECYNHDNENLDGNSEEITCNNIQEVTFLVLSSCVGEVLYYEDFDRGYWDVNSGRTDWSNKNSISISNGEIQIDSHGAILRNGPTGGVTSTYLFAPGIEDSRYNAANAGHSNQISVARIKSGYYSVNPPGYVQMGIPETDSWHDGLWDPNASTNDPTIANSNYDWTPAWDHPDGTIRDMSGAVNGSAFLIRGAASTSQSIKPFYEFQLPNNGKVEQGKTYTLDLYSYVTYHDKDYMLMDVVDKNTGYIYATVPLKYPGPGLPPEASPEGFSLGWVPLTASFTVADAACDDFDANREVYIAIRGSQDRALNTGKGFGHTLIDNIMFSKSEDTPTCIADSVEINCQDECYEDVGGKFYNWHYKDGEASGTVTETFTQPGTNGGFTLDIYYLDNSFNMNINGVDLYDKELEFQSGVANSPQNVRFKSDGKKWEDSGIAAIWKFYQNDDITEDNKDSYVPVLRVDIDKYGNATLFGIRVENGELEELEAFDSSGARSLNMVHWVEDTSIPNANSIIVSQNVVGVTAMTVYGYGRNVKECEFCTLEKDGAFNDLNEDSFAQVGETITYTFKVKNAGDMDIHDVTIVDPLFGFNITIDENTKQPIPSNVTLEGDTNGNGVLNWNETWTFTVDYLVTQEDIYTNAGVYNRAEVEGVGKLSSTSEFNFSEKSTDPTPYDDTWEGWDHERPFHTYVPLKGGGLMITNPMIHQKVKKIGN